VNFDLKLISIRVKLANAVSRMEKLHWLNNSALETAKWLRNENQKRLKGKEIKYRFKNEIKLKPNRATKT